LPFSVRNTATANVREMPDVEVTPFGPIGGSHTAVVETHHRKRVVVTVSMSAFWRKADISDAVANVR